jgi:hypothetical protein
MEYGEERDYPKIEIWRKYPGPASTGWSLDCITTWSKTCKEAKARYLASPDGRVYAHAADRIKCHFSKR